MASSFGTRRDGRRYPKSARDVNAAVDRLIEEELKAGKITPEEANRLREEQRAKDPYYEKRHPVLARLKHEGRSTAVKHKVVYVDGRYEVT